LKCGLHTSASSRDGGAGGGGSLGSLLNVRIPYSLVVKVASLTIVATTSDETCYTHHQYRVEDLVAERFLRERP
jgi:hypothetical protein